MRKFNAASIPLIWLLLLPIHGHAVLGEVADPAVHTLNNVVTKRSNVSIRYLDHTEGNASVREYARADNTVFAVKWRGHGRPDLPTLLGRYHGEFKIATAMPNSRIPRRALSASSGNLEISMYGTMSNLHGIVILKTQMPANVKADELP
jgi:hypothetical protein